jgi:transcriptional regulator with XRE-family HTH domain
VLEYSGKVVHDMKIGEKIKKRRMELKWSQRELAEKMGYNHSTITRIENGKIDIPQSRISQFAEVLGVSVGYLMNWVSEEKGNEIDAIADIAMQIMKDDELFSIVEKIAKLDAEKRQAVIAVLNAFEVTGK